MLEIIESLARTIGIALLLCCPVAVAAWMVAMAKSDKK